MTHIYIAMTHKQQTIKHTGQRHSLVVVNKLLQLGVAHFLQRIWWGALKQFVRVGDDLVGREAEDARGTHQHVVHTRKVALRSQNFLPQVNHVLLIKVERECGYLK
jgi:hypothetical protein